MAQQGNTRGRAHFATDAQEAERYEAAQRLTSLIERREALLPDAEDAAVQSEITSIESEMRAAEAAVRAFS